MKIAWLALLPVPFLLGSTVDVWPDDDARGSAVKGPTLARIKALAGEWILLDDEGKPTDDIGTTFRVTAGGSAVLETLFPGTEDEMLTVYHQNGDRLMLTHYCKIGNQPRMRARTDTKADELVFEFVDGTNMSRKDRAMRSGRFHFLGENRMRTEWKMIEDGKVLHTARFDLVRKGSSKKKGEKLLGPVRD